MRKVYRPYPGSPPIVMHEGHAEVYPIVMCRARWQFLWRLLDETLARTNDARTIVALHVPYLILSEFLEREPRPTMERLNDLPVLKGPVELFPVPRQ